uniref:PLAT domain-containing protein n=1 Tax=Ciona savignyi TaxID=51511 RepID=H2Y9W7_CIOSA
MPISFLMVEFIKLDVQIGTVKKHGFHPWLIRPRAATFARLSYLQQASTRPAMNRGSLPIDAAVMKNSSGVCLRCGHSETGIGGNRCRRMGYWATPPNGRKNQVKYYLTTSSHNPFTVKHYQVQIHWRNDTKTYSNVNIEGFKAKLYLTFHGERGSTAEIALNDGSTFHVIAGKTTRFLVTQDTTQDIGEIQRITFRWERPTCWTWFFCPTENIHLKRIKIFDATEQRRYVYLPLGQDRKGRIQSYEIEPDTQFELLRTSYIRTLFPKKHKA